MTPRRLRPLALMSAMLVLAAGCASTFRRARSALGLGSAYATGITEDELNQALVGFALRFAVGVGTAADQIESSASDREVRRRALIWRIRMIPIAQRATVVADPQQSYVALLTLAIAQRKYLTEGDGGTLFGAEQAIAQDEARQLEAGALELGARFLSAKQLDAVRWQVEDVTWKYPIRGVFQVEMAQRGYAQTESWGTFDWVIGLPMAPFRALEGVDSGAQAIHEFNATAREFSSVVAQLPETVRWQAELLLYDAESLDTVKGTAAAVDTLATSAARLSAAAEHLPQDVREQVSALLQQVETSQSGLRATLADLNGAMANGVTLAQSLQKVAREADRAGTTWHALVSDLQGTEAESKGRTFDVLDYERTAARIESAAAEVRELVGDARGAPSGLAALLDTALWRLLILLVAFFGLRFAARRLEDRWRPR